MSLANQHRAVAEINLAALRANYRALAQINKRTEVMAVVKADAYGHGAVRIAETLADEGCRHFGVATIEEASELRKSGRRERIYLLGGFFSEDAADIVDLALTPFVFDSASIRSISAAAARFDGQVRVHLKLDTGATRLGVRLADLPLIIEELRRAGNLRLEGVATLLANAAEPSSPITDRQLAEFSVALKMLSEAGFAPHLAHVANSAALTMRTDTHFTMLRPGLALYGVQAVEGFEARLPLCPVMSFRARLAQIKPVPAGTGVSYGHTFVTKRPSKIGIVAVGYADGYRRGLQNGGEVLIRGRRAPVVGAVCMDLTMVDLTDVPQAEPGDEVILWGASGGEVIDVGDVARLVNTISYEMLCTVGKRVPRIYIDEPSDGASVSSREINVRASEC